MKGIIYVINLSEYDKQKFINIYLETEQVNIPVIMYAYQNDKDLFDFCAKFLTNRTLKMTEKDYQTLYDIHNTMGYTFNPLEIIIDEFNFDFPDGLTARELLLLQYIHGKRVKGQVAQYFFDDYYLDTNLTLKMLVKEGFITTKDYLFNLEYATKPELQKALKDELPKKAPKSKYLEVIKQKLSDEQLKFYFSNICYKLTPLGESVLKKCPDIGEFHNSYYRYAFDLSIDEYYYLRLIKPELPTNDLIRLLINAAKERKPSIFTWPTISNEKTEIVEKVEEVQEVEEVKEIEKIEVIEEVKEEPIKENIEEEKRSGTDELSFEAIIKKYQDSGDKMSIKVSDEEFFNIVFRKRETEKLKDKPETKVEVAEPEPVIIAEEVVHEEVVHEEVTLEPEVEVKKEVELPPIKFKEEKVHEEPHRDFDERMIIEDIPLHVPFLLNFIISSIICIIIILCYFLFLT